MKPIPPVFRFNSKFRNQNLPSDIIGVLSSRKTQSRRSAFTLLEIIVAISMLVILAGLLVPIAKDAIADAKISSLTETVNIVKKAAMRYYYDTGKFPIEDESTGKFYLSRGSPDLGWKGPYIDHPLTVRDNPWHGSLRVTNSPLGEPGGANGFLVGGKAIDVGCELVFSGVEVSAANKTDKLFDGILKASEGVCEFGSMSGSGVATEVHVLIAYPH